MLNFPVRNVSLGKRGLDYGMVNGYGCGQIWYVLKADPSGCLLPKTRTPTNQNLANGLTLSTGREN